MEIVQTEIINAHGSKVVLEDDVPEYQELVVSTNSMSHDDWKKARGFAGWLLFCILISYFKSQSF